MRAVNLRQLLILKPFGMVFFTASKGRLGFAADVQYVETEAESKALEPLFG